MRKTIMKCDRCDSTIKFVTIVKTLTGEGKLIDNFDLCDECYEDLRNYFNDDRSMI